MPNPDPNFTNRPTLILDLLNKKREKGNELSALFNMLMANSEEKKLLRRKGLREIEEHVKNARKAAATIGIREKFNNYLPEGFKVDNASDLLNKTYDALKFLPPAEGALKDILTNLAINIENLPLATRKAVGLDTIRSADLIARFNVEFQLLKEKIAPQSMLFDDDETSTCQPRK